MTPLWLYPPLFLTGLAAGFVDAIAGGGGLVTLPVLLNLGLSPPDALGTNKLQAVFGSGCATWHYGRAGLIDPRACGSGIVFPAAGGDDSPAAPPPVAQNWRGHLRTPLTSLNRMPSSSLKKKKNIQ